MHELGIAVSLVDAACEQLRRLGPEVRVRALHLRVGPLAGVVAEALRFSFDVAAAGTEIAGARLDITAVPLVAWCDRCRAERAIVTAEGLRCPACGAPTPRIVTGRELEFSALEVDDGGANR